VSIGRNAEESNGKSDAPAISGDGRFVAFVSSATNLVADRDENKKKTDVYLVCLATEHTTRVSVDTAGRSFGAGYAPALSGDGRYVAFTADERSPQPGHSKTSKVSAVRAVYVRDTVAAITTCVSCLGGFTSKGRAAFAPDISTDGRITVFTVASAPNSDRTDIAVHDRSTSETRIVTHHANAWSAAPRVSGDGRTIVFESWASNLLCASACRPEDIDDNLLPDIYLFDRDAGRFRRVSGERGSWWSPSRAPNVDRDGRTVVFLSRQPFGPEDSTVDFDLYVCHTTCR
jgi:Tol biopolymer transport system component